MKMFKKNLIGGSFHMRMLASSSLPIRARTVGSLCCYKSTSQLPQRNAESEPAAPIRHQGNS